MRVEDANNSKAAGLGLAVDPQVGPRVNRVQPRRIGDVCRADAGLDDRSVQWPNKQATALLRIGTQAMRDHLLAKLGWKDQTNGSVVDTRTGHRGRTLPCRAMPAKQRPRRGASVPHRGGAVKERAPVRTVARNRRARHEYDILETFECGIELRGGEVKSLRAGQVQLQDAYARVEEGEVWLLGAHVAPYEYSGGFGYVDPDRPRKLLLHRAQIDELQGRVAQQSLTLVPLSIYFKEGKAKLELALARGRRLYDKRRAIANRDAAREAERALKEYRGR